MTLKSFIYKLLYSNYRYYIMADVTTIQLDKELLENLKKVKEYPKQSYNELITHMVELFKNVKAKNQYDEFLHKIQQQKMKELWDNEKDEVWNNV